MPNPYTIDDLGGLGEGAVIKGALQSIFRAKDRDAALGMLSAPQTGLTTAATAVSQNIYGTPHYLYAGEVVTNVICLVQTAASGTAPSNIKLGLWQGLSTPVCVAVTAELSADARWTTTGYKVNALSAPFTVGTSGIYYAAFWENGAFGTTALQIDFMLGGQGVAANAIGSAPPIGGALKTGATTMAAADTGTYSAAGTAWLALS